jgi:hypothetical protein
MAADHVTFEPKGYRDVHWCPRLNEPVIIQYTGIPGGSVADTPSCTNCGEWGDDHVFICHILKPQ